MPRPHIFRPLLVSLVILASLLPGCVNIYVDNPKSATESKSATSSNPAGLGNVLFEESFTDNPLAGSCWSAHRYRGDAVNEAVWSRDGYMVLTKADEYLGAALVPCEELPVSGWKVSFDYWINAGAFGGDGIAFMFNKDTSYLSTMGTGWTLGIAGYTETPPAGYAVEVDNYPNDWEAPANSLATVGGNDKETRQSYSPFLQAEDGQWHTVTVDHCQAGLAVSVDGNLLLTDPGPFSSKFHAFGFTATTGSASHEQRLDNVVLRDCA